MQDCAARATKEGNRRRIACAEYVQNWQRLAPCPERAGFHCRRQIPGSFTPDAPVLQDRAAHTTSRPVLKKKRPPRPLAFAPPLELAFHWSRRTLRPSNLAQCRFRGARGCGTRDRGGSAARTRRSRHKAHPRHTRGPDHRQKPIHNHLKTSKVHSQTGRKHTQHGRLKTGTGRARRKANVADRLLPPISLVLKNQKKI